MPDHYKELLTLAGESTGEGLLTGDINESLSNPRPKLFLCSPEFILVRANNSGCLLRLQCYAFTRIDVLVRPTESTSG